MYEILKRSRSLYGDHHEMTIIYKHVDKWTAQWMLERIKAEHARCTPIVQSTTFEIIST